jgi:hypothetical protein
MPNESVRIEPADNDYVIACGQLRGTQQDISQFQQLPQLIREPSLARMSADYAPICQVDAWAITARMGGDMRPY